MKFVNPFQTFNNGVKVWKGVYKLIHFCIYFLNILRHVIKFSTPNCKGNCINYAISNNNTGSVADTIEREKRALYIHLRSMIAFIYISHTQFLQ